jgi:hypothetical protein
MGSSRTPAGSDERKLELAAEDTLPDATPWRLDDAAAYDAARDVVIERVAELAAADDIAMATKVAGAARRVDGFDRDALDQVLESIASWLPPGEVSR